MSTSTAKPAGPTPARRHLAPITRLERESALRRARRERRRLDRRRDGRFEHLKRAYD